MSTRKYFGWDKKDAQQYTGPIFLSEHDPPTRSPSLGPNESLPTVPKAPRGCNRRKRHQKPRSKQFGQRKKGQWHRVVKAIKEDYSRNEDNHPRGYTFDTHWRVTEVPAPTEFNLTRSGVRTLPSGVVDHYIHITEDHVPIPSPNATAHEIRHRFRRAKPKTPHTIGKQT